MISPNTFSVNQSNRTASAQAAAGSEAPRPKPSNTPEPESREVTRGADARPEDRAKEIREQETEASRRREEIWEDIVAVSEDGDTVRVSDEGNEELEDSRIGQARVLEEGDRSQLPSGRQDIQAPELAEQQEDARMQASDDARQAKSLDQEAKAEQEKLKKEREDALREAEENRRRLIEDSAEAREETARRMESVREEQAEAEDVRQAEPAQAGAQPAQGTAEESAPASEAESQAETEQKPSSYAGISDQRLEQMYREGVISRQDYEAEVDSRQAEREQRAEESEAFSVNTVQRAAVSEESSRTNAAIERAYGGKTSETLSAEQRMDVIEKLSETESEKARREEEQGRLWDYQLVT